MTVAHSAEQGVALVKATTHGTVFVVTGGDHFTLDDMFFAAELSSKEGTSSTDEER